MPINHLLALLLFIIYYVVKIKKSMRCSFLIDLVMKFLFVGVKKYRCQSAVNECREYFLAWELREISYLQVAM